MSIQAIVIVVFIFALVVMLSGIASWFWHRSMWRKKDEWDRYYKTQPDEGRGSE